MRIRSFELSCRRGASLRRTLSASPSRSSVLGAESHTLWKGWVEVHQLVRAWLLQAEAFELKDATHGLQIIDPGGMAERLAGFFARHPMPERLSAGQ